MHHLFLTTKISWLVRYFLPLLSHFPWAEADTVLHNTGDQHEVHLLKTEPWKFPQCHSVATDQLSAAAWKS